MYTWYRIANKPVPYVLCHIRSAVSKEQCAFYLMEGKCHLQESPAVSVYASQEIRIMYFLSKQSRCSADVLMNTSRAQAALRVLLLLLLS